MAHINLLPWREARRHERRRQFIGVLTGAAILALVVVFAGWWYIGQMLQYQQSRNAYLTAQIAAMDAKIAEIEKLEETRARLLARKRIIEELQADRAEMVHLFDELAKTIPDGVYLTALAQNGNVLTLTGLAESNARVSQYMRNLQNSEWLFSPELRIVERMENQTNGLAQRFELQVSTEPPQAIETQNFEQQAVGQ